MGCMEIRRNTAEKQVMEEMGRREVGRGKREGKEGRKKGWKGVR